MLAGVPWDLVPVWSLCIPCMKRETSTKWFDNVYRLGWLELAMKPKAFIEELTKWETDKPRITQTTEIEKKKKASV